MVCENCGEVFDEPVPGRELSIVIREREYIVITKNDFTAAMLHSCELAD